MPAEKRELSDLVSVGPAMLRDFEILGVRTLAQLARRDPRRLYHRLCRRLGQSIDLCCQDVFAAAVAQARDPHLSVEECQWWYWSRKRKREPAGDTARRNRKKPVGRQPAGYSR